MSDLVILDLLFVSNWEILARKLITNNSFIPFLTNVSLQNSLKTIPGVKWMTLFDCEGQWT